MQVTALNQKQVERAAKAIESGCMQFEIAESMSVTPKTLRRAIKLYKRKGNVIFMPEKIPARGRRN